MLDRDHCCELGPLECALIFGLFFKQRPLQLFALKAIKIIKTTHERTYLPTYETSLTSLTNTKTSLTSLTTTKTSLTITETSIKTVTRTTK